jgi:hypothetical protein
LVAAKSMGMNRSFGVCPVMGFPGRNFKLETVAVRDGPNAAFRTRGATAALAAA